MEDIDVCRPSNTHNNMICLSCHGPNDVMDLMIIIATFSPNTRFHNNRRKGVNYNIFDPIAFA